MKNMTPRFIVLGGGVLLAAVAGVIAGCSSDDDAAPTTQIDAGPDVVIVPDSGPPPEDGGPDAAKPVRKGNTDRAGRAAIIEAIISAENKDPYNRMDPYKLTGGLDPAVLEVELQRGLATVDMTDGVSNWDGGSPDGSVVEIPNDAGPDGGDAGVTPVTVYPHPLIPLMTTDALILDITKPFAPDGYLEIEYQTLVGTPGSHATCGGRWMTDDAVDKTLSFVMKKSLTGVSDGVSQATQAPTLTFPYLAPPNP